MTTSSDDVSVTSQRQLVAALTMAEITRPAVSWSLDSTSAQGGGAAAWAEGVATERRRRVL